MYNSFNAAMRERFGRKIYRLALNGGMTCPNRDGTLGTEGCIFCGEAGSGEFAEKRAGSVHEQIEAAKKRILSKTADAGYVAYFQSYSNTYAPVSYLDRLFTEAIAHPDIVALSIATRPDCLPDDTIALLKSLNGIKPVWVELGLQTIHEKSAEYIKRGYGLETFDSAVSRLLAAGLEIVVHMIIGLPEETEGMIRQTAAYIGGSGAQGVKFHLLHVLRGTELYRQYEAGLIKTLSMDEYIRILCGCIERIPADMVIHRLTGDGAKSLLAAPLWSADKKRVLNAISAYVRENGIVQGARFER